MSENGPGRLLSGCRPVWRWSRGLAGALVGVLCLVATSAAAQSSAAPGDRTVAAIVQVIDAGQFRTADARIAAALNQPQLDAATRTALRFQRVRMRRIRKDFDVTAEAIKARIRQQVPSLTEAQFARWVAHGWIERKVIDGTVWYFDRAASNLFRLSAPARALRRNASPLDPSGLPVSMRRTLARYDQKVIAAARSSRATHVMPQRIQVTQSLVVDADVVPAGKVVRAWIPYPQAIDGQQEDIAFVASMPAAHTLAPASARQRTVYLEKRAQAGKPTRFSVTWQVTLYAQYHAIDAAKVVPAKITPALAPYVAERAPHVVFTGPLRVFSNQIVGDTTNPWRIAQKLYAAVDKIPWAGAREYSTLSNISAYTLRAGHGDCGEQTLLLITLLRMNGIPARWQSGWIFTADGYDNIHDWAQMYIAPYGWVPVDVTYGRFDVADPALRGFYLGGLDNFRVAFNTGFGGQFVPAKQHFRSDTVDSQRGEVEWDGGNLYYDQWRYHFRWKILPADQG